MFNKCYLLADTLVISDIILINTEVNFANKTSFLGKKIDEYLAYTDSSIRDNLVLQVMIWGHLRSLSWV